jgi:hypothetical protein
MGGETRSNAKDLAVFGEIIFRLDDSNEKIMVLGYRNHKLFSFH